MNSDKRKEYRNLIDPERAREIICSMDYNLSTKKIPIANAVGRKAGEYLYAPRDVPSFARSKMDGYAVVASDTYGADEQHPVKLQVEGTVEMGSPPTIDICSGIAAEIATGAPIPKGCNAVVKVEDTTKHGESIRIYSALAPGDNIIHAASDIAAGDLLLWRNQLIRPGVIAALAAVGRKEVTVRQLPTIGILSTGPELKQQGQQLNFGEIYDSNSQLLQASLSTFNVPTNFYGIVPDSMEELLSRLTQASQECNLILTSGGTSAGTKDLVHRVATYHGEILAHGIKLKPGKPTIIGKFNNTPLIGLPGNPGSAYVVFNNLVAPWLSEIRRGSSSLSSSRKAKLLDQCRSEEGRKEQKFVGLTKQRNNLSAYPIRKSSNSITGVIQADGYVEIPEGTVLISEGTEIQVQLFTPLKNIPELTIMGSNCLGLNQLLQKLPFTARIISCGSLGGINAIQQGMADIAGIHIWTEEGYNKPYIKQRNLEDPALIRGYKRTQGFLVQPGNPKNINSITDLVERKPTIINRNSGSGTRLLLDHKLREFANTHDLSLKSLARSIPGYEVEVSSHNGVGSAVAADKADTGVGLRAAADNYDLDFVPLQQEYFDFLTKKPQLEQSEIRVFRQRLQNREFLDRLEELPGIKACANIGEVIYRN